LLLSLHLCQPSLLPKQQQQQRSCRQCLAAPHYSAQLLLLLPLPEDPLLGSLLLLPHRHRHLNRL
jgi:hypothetical protein